MRTEDFTTVNFVYLPVFKSLRFLFYFACIHDLYFILSIIILYAEYKVFEGIRMYSYTHIDS